MPVYVYAIVDDSGVKRDHFEIRQRMSDPTLTHHPETGEPVVRVPQVPAVLTRGGRTGDTSSVEGLVKRGFTRYENAGDGKYVKTGGPADTPDTIQR